jgi:hypothetical protein
MKRTNVVVDETLLEQAMRVTGERTYSAVMQKGLEELVRVATLKRGIQALKDTNDVFWPHYVEELRPNSYAGYAKRRAAYRGTKGGKTRCGARTR